MKNEPKKERREATLPAEYYIEIYKRYAELADEESKRKEKEEREKKEVLL